VKIGFTLPQMGPIAGETTGIRRFAIEAERLGADSLWAGDRLLAPTDPTVGYGGGDTIPAAFRQVLDPFALMSLAAAVTDRAEIGVNVLNAPWYPPALLARSLTTIDRISEGRLLPGFGVGWSPEEYAAAGVAMSERGARLDECLDVLEAWWTTNPVAYTGRYTTVPSTYVDLKPVRRPPIYLAGFAPAALRRVALRGDGWLPVHVPDRGPFDPAGVTGPIGRIREIARDNGRDPAAFGLVLRVYPQGAATLASVVDALVRAERLAGVEHAFVELMNVATSVDDALDVVDKVLRAARG
jgi:probable F420-dependent oxidoreductase